MQVPNSGTVYISTSVKRPPLYSSHFTVSQGWPLFIHRFYCTTTPFFSFSGHSEPETAKACYTAQAILANQDERRPSPLLSWLPALCPRHQSGYSAVYEDCQGSIPIQKRTQTGPYMSCDYHVTLITRVLLWCLHLLVFGGLYV